jgi:hypothetical protein
VTAAEQHKFDQAIGGRGAPEGEVLLQHPCGLDVTRRHLQCMRFGEWLNDEVVNVFMALLQVGRRCRGWLGVSSWGLRWLLFGGSVHSMPCGLQEARAAPCLGRLAATSSFSSAPSRELPGQALVAAQGGPAPWRPTPPPLARPGTRAPIAPWSQDRDTRLRQQHPGRFPKVHYFNSFFINKLYKVRLAARACRMHAGP